MAGRIGDQRVIPRPEAEESLSLYGLQTCRSRDGSTAPHVFLAAARLGITQTQAMMKQPVIIVDYDPGWPNVFEAEKTRLLNVTGEFIIAIEHVGSTSVPGLGAKPLIDTLAGVRTLAEGRQTREPLTTQLGYEYMPEYEVEMPYRLFFHKHPPA